MKYYVVMDISRATADNDNFSGSGSVHFCGRRTVQIGSKASGKYAEYVGTPCTGWSIQEYAYTRRCDAARNWCYKHPENSGYWESFTRIVEINAETPGAAAAALDKLADALVDAFDIVGVSVWDQMVKHARQTLKLDA